MGAEVSGAPGSSKGPQHPDSEAMTVAFAGFSSGLSESWELSSLRMKNSYWAFSGGTIHPHIRPP
jgi:hypothetical protein